MSEVRIEAIKERLYMERELRRLKGLPKWMREHKQGRINFLHRHIVTSRMIWN